MFQGSSGPRGPEGPPGKPGEDVSKLSFCVKKEGKKKKAHILPHLMQTAIKRKGIQSSAVKFDV